MRIVGMMPMHGRDKITAATIRVAQKQTLPLERLVVVGKTEAERKVAADCGVDFFEHENIPLFKKFQHGLYHLRQFDPDAVVLWPSDCWLSPRWLEIAAEYIKNGAALVGKPVFHVCHANKDSKLLIRPRSYRIGGHRWPEPAGGGRVFSRDVLDKLDWTLFIKKLTDRQNFDLVRQVAKGTYQMLEEGKDDAYLVSFRSNTWANITHISTYENPGFQKYPDIVNPKQWLSDIFFPEIIDLVKYVVPSVKF
jgi:hypothetical protein